MTNIEAFRAYDANEGVGELTLARYLIVETESDKLDVCAGLGMISKSLSVNYKQGNTAENLSDKTRDYLRRKGEALLRANGVEVEDDGDNCNQIFGGSM